MATSRPYRITVRESLHKVLVVEDSVRTRLDFPPILPNEQMSAILTGVLQGRGFSPQGDQLIRDHGGVRAAIQPLTGEVTVSTHGSEEIDLSDEGDLPSCTPCAERAKESLREGLREKLKHAADERERSLQEKVTDRLEASLVELSCELERVSNQVASKALVQKAATLGEITKITQDPETGAMTIVVAV
jgi:hypothetical protein